MLVKQALNITYHPSQLYQRDTLLFAFTCPNMIPTFVSQQLLFFVFCKMTSNFTLTDLVAVLASVSQMYLSSRRGRLMETCSQEGNDAFIGIFNCHFTMLDERAPEPDVRGHYPNDECKRFTTNLYHVLSLRHVARQQSNSTDSIKR